MASTLGNLLLFAADEGQGGSMLLTFMPIIIIGVLFWLLLIRPQSREAQQRRRMVEAVKPNDRVVTIGGIHGVVAGVNRDRGTASIRVDEGNNTKITISLSAIHQVLIDESSKETATK